MFLMRRFIRRNLFGYRQMCGSFLHRKAFLKKRKPSGVSDTAHTLAGDKVGVLAKHKNVRFQKRVKSAPSRCTG